MNMEYPSVYLELPWCLPLLFYNFKSKSYLIPLWFIYIGVPGFSLLMENKLDLLLFCCCCCLIWFGLVLALVFNWIENVFLYVVLVSWSILHTLICSNSNFCRLFLFFNVYNHGFYKHNLLFFLLELMHKLRPSLPCFTESMKVDYIPCFCKKEEFSYPLRCF